MQTYKPVETDLGILEGRDCIYLDEVFLKDNQTTLILVGEINGNLCSNKQSGKFISFELIFSGVIALQMIELDSWDFASKASFDEVVESDWIGELGGKVDSTHRHYLVQTYDDVFDVVCHSYQLKLKSVLRQNAES